MTDLSKTPPQNLEAEQMVLGAILIDNDALLRVSDVIQTPDFYAEKHQLIFEAMFDCYQLEGVIDLITMDERLRTKGLSEKTGGGSYLSYLVTLAPTSANIRNHARMVKEKAILRRVLRWSDGITNQAQSGVPDIREWFTGIERDVVDMSSSVREKKSPHVTDILAARKVEQEKINSGEIRRFKIPVLNPYSDEPPIPFIFPGFSMVIGGYTSCGKSTLLAQMVVDWCKQGAKGVIFSLEDPQPIKAIKLIANLSDVMQKKILMDKIEGFEDRVKEAEDIIKSWGLLIYDDVRTIDEIMLKVKKHKLQGGLDFVCVDYIQKIQGDERTDYQTLSRAANLMDDMAKDLKVATITLSQVNNDSVRNPSALMGMKGAGEIESAMDVVIRIERPKGEDYFLDAEIRKNRIFGETGKQPLAFSRFYTRVERRI
jgi:replicative DNA helicase